jgi:uncharacterized protein (TIGR03086 family)
MDVVDLHRRSIEEFAQRIEAVGEDQWSLPTPCSDWNVRTLVNHIVAENLWTPPLMEGKTIADVGDRFDGDVLDDDPKRAWREASAAAVESASQEGVMERTVHLSFGDVPGSEYALQLFADHVVHGWDLAAAIGAEQDIDPELVDACAKWFASIEDAYRAAGAIGPRPEVPAGADEQTALLAMFGRRPGWRP